MTILDHLTRHRWWRVLAAAAYCVWVADWLSEDRLALIATTEPYFFRLLGIGVGLIVGRWWVAALPLVVIPLAILKWDTGLVLAYATLDLVPTGVAAAAAGVAAHKLWAAVLHRRSRRLPGMAEAGLGALRWASIAAGVILAGLVLVVHAVLAGFACDVENSACATGSNDMTEYRGRLFTWEGRPLATRFRLSVESQYDKRDPPEFATDTSGRFCVRAPSESAPPWVIPEQITSRAAVDPRFSGPDGYPELESALMPNNSPSIPGAPIFMIGEPYQGLQLQGGPVTPSTALAQSPNDSAFTCQEAGRLAEWYRYDDLDRSWQFFFLLALPAASIVLLGAAGGRGLPTTARWAAWAIGLAGAVASAGVFVVLWDYKQEPTRGPEAQPAWLTIPLADLRTLPDFEPRTFAPALRRSILSEGYPPRNLVRIRCGPGRSCDITMVNAGVAGTRLTDRVIFERTPVPTCWRLHSARRVKEPARPSALAKGSFNVPGFLSPICPHSGA